EGGVLAGGAEAGGRGGHAPADEAEGVFGPVGGRGENRRVEGGGVRRGVQAGRVGQRGRVGAGQIGLPVVAEEAEAGAQGHGGGVFPVARPWQRPSASRWRTAIIYHRLRNMACCRAGAAAGCATSAA